MWGLPLRVSDTRISIIIYRIEILWTIYIQNQNNKLILWKKLAYRWHVLYVAMCACKKVVLVW